VKRWLVVAAALALAAGAFLFLATREPPSGGPPLEHIDEASRARLEQLLREPEGRGEAPR
jgi:hypothetical protein